MPMSIKDREDFISSLSDSSVAKKIILNGICRGEINRCSKTD